MSHATKYPVSFTLADRCVWVTAHAAFRWGERVRSGATMSFREIEADLRRLTPIAIAITAPPPWWVQSEFAEVRVQVDGWIMYGEDIAMALVGDLAVTVVTRGALRDGERASPESPGTERPPRQGARLQVRRQRQGGRQG